VLLAACGSTAAPPAPVGPPAALIATPGASDSVVAHVDGRPVLASCVAAQAAHDHVSRDAALARCVDFELLALAAERAGKATDREVVLATKTALASRTVELGYEDAFTKPSDFGSAWTQATDRTSKQAAIWQFEHDEYRASTYVRIPVPDHASADVDAAAHALADRIADAVKDERGMYGADLVARARQVTPLEGCAPTATKPCWQDVTPYREIALDNGYAKALFGLPEVGRASAPTRTKWGWDVIVLTDIVPAAAPTPAELDADVLPLVRRAYFVAWVSSIAHAMGIHVDVAPDTDARLEAMSVSGE
jgi:hypothetical protein